MGRRGCGWNSRLHRREPCGHGHDRTHGWPTAAPGGSVLIGLPATVRRHGRRVSGSEDQERRSEDVDERKDLVTTRQIRKMTANMTRR